MTDTVKTRVFGFEMARIAEVYVSKLSALMTPKGLDRYYTAFLWICENNGKLTQKELGEMIKRDKVYTTRIVDHLCNCDLVVRRPDETDKRCHILEITDKAKSILPDLRIAIETTNDFIMNELRDSERDDYLRNLQSIFNYIDSMPEPDYFVESVKSNAE